MFRKIWKFLFSREKLENCYHHYIEDRQSFYDELNSCRKIIKDRVERENDRKQIELIKTAIKELSEENYDY